MEDIATLLLIVGCSDSLKDCREIPPLVSVFETMEKCGSVDTLARKAALRSTPCVYSQCLYVGPAMGEGAAQLIWRVKDGKVLAEVIDSGGATASLSRKTSVEQGDLRRC